MRWCGWSLVSECLSMSVQGCLVSELVCVCVCVCVGEASVSQRSSESVCRGVWYRNFFIFLSVLLATLLLSMCLW